MKPASAALHNYLNSLGPTSPALYADLVTFALADGTTLRYSMAQYSLSPPANSFQPPDANGNGASINYSASPAPLSFPVGPVFSRAKSNVKLGLDPGSAQLSIFPHPPGLLDAEDAPDLVGGFSWQEAATLGFFNGATVEVDRLFMPQLGDYSLGSYVLHLGRVGQMKIGRSKIDMETPNLLILLSGQYPNRLFQPSCTWVFGDNNCTFNRASLAQTVTALAGSTKYQISADFTASPASLFNGGTITGTSGANNGVSRAINTAIAGSPGTIYPTVPFYPGLAAGDTFQILPGCDHTLSTCNGAFNNFRNFGGFPYIPPPEAAV